VITIDRQQENVRLELVDGVLLRSLLTMLISWMMASHRAEWASNTL